MWRIYVAAPVATPEQLIIHAAMPNIADRPPQSVETRLIASSRLAPASKGAHFHHSTSHDGNGSAAATPVGPTPGVPESAACAVD
jgi:hypothetical protein